MVKLQQKELFALMKYVEAEFTKSGLAEPEFAVKAQEVLENPRINPGHVQTIRKSLGIPANKETGGKVANAYADLKARMVGLEEMILAQSIRLDDCVRKIETLQRDLHLHPLGMVPKGIGRAG